MKTRILVTGGNGFVGRELKARLTALGHELLAPTRAELELTDKNAVEKAVLSFKPSQIYHLAGISRVNDSLGVPEYFNANTLSTLSLLHALKKLNNKQTFFYASSMHVYGNQALEVSEETGVSPLSYYAFTKYLSEQVIKNSAQSMPQTRFIIGRLYSCFGPGQPEGFVTSDLIRKILRLKKENGAVLKTGPLNTYRRFVDVRDAVQVMMQLMALPHEKNWDVFNLASPHEMTIQEILNALLKIAGISPKIESQADAKNAFLGLRVNTRKLFSIINASAFRPVDTTLRDMVKFASNTGA